MKDDKLVEITKDFLLQMMIIAATLDDLKNQLEKLKRIEQ